MMDGLWDADLQREYETWRATEDGEAAFVNVRDRAFRLQERGWSNFGIAALFEAARYDRALQIGPDWRGFKMNNNHRAFMARELMASFPRLEGFFRLRASVADR